MIHAFLSAHAMRTTILFCIILCTVFLVPFLPKAHAGGGGGGGGGGEGGINISIADDQAVVTNASYDDFSSWAGSLGMDVNGFNATDEFGNTMSFDPYSDGSGGDVTADYTPNDTLCQSFTATPSTLSGPGSVTLEWKTSMAYAVSINNGALSSNVNGSRSASFSETETVTLYVYSPPYTSATSPNTPAEVQDTCTVTVTVQEEVPAPTCDAFTASPSAVPAAGGNVRFTWQTSNATGVSLWGAGESVNQSLSPDDSHTMRVVPKTQTLQIWGPGGQTLCTVDVNEASMPPLPQTPTCNITASPSSVPASGGNVTFSWTASNNTGASLYGAGNPPNPFGPGNGSHRMRVTPKTQILEVWNSSESRTCQVVVRQSSTTPPPEPPPEPPPSSTGANVTLTARNNTTSGPYTSGTLEVPQGDDVRIRWSTSFTREEGTAGIRTQNNLCSGTGFSTGTGRITGSDSNVTEPPVGSTRTYRVNCNYPGIGSDSDTVTVRVVEAIAEPPILEADPKYVHVEDDADIVWDTNGNDPASCTLQGPDVNLLTLPSETGSHNVTVYGESTYTLTCPGGEASVTIKVLPVIQET